MKIMKYFVVVFLLLRATLVLAEPAIPLKEPGVLNVTSYSEFTPISYGNGEGYEADMIRAIAKLWHVKVKFHPVSDYKGIWLIPSQKNSSSDIAIAGLTPSKERINQGAIFSITTMPFEQSLLIRKKDYESRRITSYRSFKNTSMKIGVVPDTTGEKYAYLRAKESGVSSSVIVQYASESELLPALMSGKIDAIARGTIGNEYQAAINKSLITIEKKNFHEGFAFAVDKSNPVLAKKLNEAILIVTHQRKIGYQQWLKNHNILKNNT